MHDVSISRSLTAGSLVALALLTGCGDKPTPAEPPAASTEAPATPAPVAEAPSHLAPASPESIAAATQLGALARSLLRTPERADALLAEASLTRDAFEARIYEAASHPATARAYRDALEAP